MSGLQSGHSFSLTALLPEKTYHFKNIVNVQNYPYKVPVILVGFYSNLNFLERFSKNTQILNFTKIRPVGAELFHADGQILQS